MINLKKRYQKPDLICQELRPETLLCACSILNPDFNESQQCSYTPKDLGFPIFAQSWTDCAIDDPADFYCYHNGTAQLFGS